MPDTDTTTEIWKAVAGYEGLYDVSNLGRVRSYYTYGHRWHVIVSSEPQRFLNRHLDSNRYRCVVLYTSETRREFKVHILVAAAFIGPKPLGREVNHIDGNKSNNQIDNLEYVTRSQNLRHASKLGLWHPFKGQAHPMAKLTDDDVKEIRAIRDTFITVTKRVRMPIAEIARRFHVSVSTIENVLARRNWYHVK